MFAFVGCFARTIVVFGCPVSTCLACVWVGVTKWCWCLVIDDYVYLWGSGMVCSVVAAV